MSEDCQRCHVHVETFPVDQQGGSWLSLIDLRTFMLTLHELHQSIDVVYHLYLGKGHFKIIKHTYFLSKLHVKLEQFLNIVNYSKTECI